MELPYKTVEFTKSGGMINDVEPVLTWIAEHEITDLFIMSHGWNNDMAEANELYLDLSGFLWEEISAVNQGKKYGLIGIYWPSKKFADEDLIAGGGAASLQTGDEQKTHALLNILSTEFSEGENQTILNALKDSVRRLRNQPEAADEFVTNVSRLLKAAQQSFVHVEDKLASNLEGETSAKTLLASLENVDQPSTPVNNGGGVASMPGSVNGVGETGGAAGNNIFSGIFGGARNLLNVTTYYLMKERAGNVGAEGVGPLLVSIIDKFPSVKLHLIGHSFGGRVMASAVATLPATYTVKTLVLLQAAFSHFGFSGDYDGNGGKGLFHPAIAQQKVKGPIVISHTLKDLAVGKAYAIASRLANQNAAFVGGPNDKFGGIGANGAQKSNATIGSMLKTNQPYTFVSGLIYNLKADPFITGHSDIRNAEVAHAIVSAANS